MISSPYSPKRRMLHDINKSFESIFSDSVEDSVISSPRQSVRQSHNKIGYR